VVSATAWITWWGRRPENETHDVHANHEKQTHGEASSGIRVAEVLQQPNDGECWAGSVEKTLPKMFISKEGASGRERGAGSRERMEGETSSRSESSLYSRAASPTREHAPAQHLAPLSFSESCTVS